MLIHVGTQDRLIAESTTQAGTTSKEGSISSDSLLCTLWVDSVTSGSLDVSVFTLTDNGKEVLLFSFPSISAPTVNLLMKKSGISMQRFRVVATYTGSCSYEVYIRAVAGAGESSTRIIGAANLSTSSATVTTTPSVLIASALTDRNGLTLRNYAGGGVLHVSESLSKLTADSWPVGPGEVWSLDIAAGVTIYAVASSGSIDVRIAESGG